MTKKRRPAEEAPQTVKPRKKAVVSWCPSIGMECVWSSVPQGASRLSPRQIRISGTWSARFHRNRQWLGSRGARTTYSVAATRNARGRNVASGNSAPLCASYLRCGAIGTVHIESAGASEKTCARFAIPGSSLNTLETPDSFARGAREALRVGFQPAKKIATALERARRKMFASLTELRPGEKKRSSLRTRGGGGARLLALEPIYAIVIVAQWRSP